MPIPRPPLTTPLRAVALVAAMTAAGCPTLAAGTDPSSLLRTYATESGAAPDPARGQRLFTTRHGGEWSCASCHADRPTRPGRHASTGKPIEPLAPGANPRRFTDSAKVEKWFRRNCKDVLSRECTAAEKADVLAWLNTLTP